jgi:hypothetical protein
MKNGENEVWNTEPKLLDEYLWWFDFRTDRYVLRRIPQVGETSRASSPRASVTDHAPV